MNSKAGEEPPDFADKLLGINGKIWKTPKRMCWNRYGWHLPTVAQREMRPSRSAGHTPMPRQAIAGTLHHHCSCYPEFPSKSLSDNAIWKSRPGKLCFSNRHIIFNFIIYKIMKKFIFALTASAALLTACSEEPGIVLNSPELAGDSIFVSGHPISDPKAKFTDTIIVAEDGSFRYAIPTADSTVKVNFDLAGTTDIPLELYVTPTEYVELTGNRLENGKFYFDVKEEGLNKGIVRFAIASEPYKAAIAEAGKAAGQAYAAKADKHICDSLLKAYNQSILAFTDFAVKYFRKNPQSPEAPYVILSVPVDSVDPCVAALPKEGQPSLVQPLLDKKILVAKEVRLKREARDRIQVGNPAPDFTLKDLEGKDLSLSSLRGKHVILDFWGSWCGWCIKGMPELKKHAKKYGDKLVVLGVDCRDKEADWKEAVKKHEMDWLHVFEPNDLPSKDKPTVIYNVNGFPTKILIDPEGKIVNITVGENPAFYEALEKAMAQ